MWQTCSGCGCCSPRMAEPRMCEGDSCPRLELGRLELGRNWTDSPRHAGCLGTCCSMQKGFGRLFDSHLFYWLASTICFALAIGEPHRRELCFGLDPGNATGGGRAARCHVRCGSDRARLAACEAPFKQMDEALGKGQDRTTSLSSHQARRPFCHAQCTCYHLFFREGISSHLSLLYVGQR